MSDKSVNLDRLVIARLEDAGRVLLALPMRGYTTHLRTGHPEVVHDFSEAYGWLPERPRIPIPSADRISRMEEALEWLSLIPGEHSRFRRVVGMRMLVSPLNDRYLFSWRGVGSRMRVDHKTAKHWHRRGVDLVTSGLIHAGIAPGVMRNIKFENPWTNSPHDAY
jgi:hypothetical protein